LVKTAGIAMVLTLGDGEEGEAKQGITVTRASEGPQVSRWGSEVVDRKGLNDEKPATLEKSETKKESIKLVNKAGESRSPYVSLQPSNTSLNTSAVEDNVEQTRHISED
jgi:hypothetical protein